MSGSTVETAGKPGPHSSYCTAGFRFCTEDTSAQHSIVKMSAHITMPVYAPSDHVKKTVKPDNQPWQLALSTCETATPYTTDVALS